MASFVLIAWFSFKIVRYREPCRPVRRPVATAPGTVPLIAWFSFKIFTQLSPVHHLHSITSGASGATGFTLAQGVVIMAFTYTHIAIPKSRRAKIELCLNGPIHFGSGATVNGSTHSNLL